MSWRILRSTTGLELARWTATVLALGGFGCDPQRPPARRHLPVLGPNQVSAMPRGSASAMASATPSSTSSASAVDVPPEPSRRSVPLAEFPEGFGFREGCDWLVRSEPQSPWSQLKKSMTAGQSVTLSPALKVLASDGSTVPEILSSLDGVEADGMYDEFIAAMVFQRTRNASGEDLVDLLGRTERHARMAIALRRAQTLTGAKAGQRAWMSKGGERSGCDITQVKGDLFDEARKAYEKGDAGGWDKDARLTLNVASSTGVEVWRRGSLELIEAGEKVVLRRLDVLVAGPTEAVLEHPTLGEIRIPAKGELGPWNTATFLSADAQKKLGDTVRLAADGNKKALNALDPVLPAARSFIEEELAKRPTAKGAAGLRMQLALFLE